MKKLEIVVCLIWLMVGFLAGAVMFGCAGTSKQTQDVLIGVLAQDVGYGVYRVVPEARMPLSSACLITDFSNPALVASQLKEILGKVWEEAKEVTDQDAGVVAITVSNLLAAFEANIDLGDSATDADIERVRAVLRLVVDNLCKGVRMAGGK